ncbi:hypothetical protein NQ318_015366 [Aromia moschata]|uniref:Uncharacterized protein n=1 Tax=Aromia moschata TaxID=1265417 RepID=A0AAV8YNY2_9CUCU|nr:hypothetical protein NQ318_015366 [Aromia moschata]
MSYECETVSGGNKSSKTSTTTQSSTGSDLAHRAPAAGDLRTWYDDLNSPLIQDQGDSKCLKLRFDVSQYALKKLS